MSDLIERQDALDALEKIGWIETKADKEYAIQLFTDLPPAQLERKNGKWHIAYVNHEAFGMRPKLLYCSRCCHCEVYPTKFCPNCGADMRKNK